MVGKRVGGECCAPSQHLGEAGHQMRGFFSLVLLYELDYRNWWHSPFTTSLTPTDDSGLRVLGDGMRWQTRASHDARTRAHVCAEIRPCSGRASVHLVCAAGFEGGD